MTSRQAVATSANEVRAALADDDAFRRWYEWTLPRVYGYVLARAAGDSTLAEELTQEAYVAAVERRAEFDGRSGSVTWLCAIARNKLVDHFRRLEREERRHRHVVVRELALERDTETARWDHREQRDAIEAAVRALPAAQRAVLTLVGLDNLSVPEVARLIGKSAAATQSLLARARDGFRQAYAREVADV